MLLFVRYGMNCLESWVICCCRWCFIVRWLLKLGCLGFRMLWLWFLIRWWCVICIFLVVNFVINLLISRLWIGKLLRCRNVWVRLNVVCWMVWCLVCLVWFVCWSCKIVLFVLVLIGLIWMMCWLSCVRNVMSWLRCVIVVIRCIWLRNLVICCLLWLIWCGIWRLILKKFCVLLMWNLFVVFGWLRLCWLFKVVVLKIVIWLRWMCCGIRLRWLNVRFRLLMWWFVLFWLVLCYRLLVLMCDLWCVMCFWIRVVVIFVCWVGYEIVLVYVVKIDVVVCRYLDVWWWLDVWLWWFWLGR